jgi:hypothetical protein
MGDRWNEVVRSAGETVDKLKSLTDFNIGEMKFPETKIGETVAKAEDWLSQKIGTFAAQPPAPTPSQETTRSPVANAAEQVVHYAEKHWPKPAASSKPPPKIPLPPPIRVRANFPPRGKK